MYFFVFIKRINLAFCTIKPADGDCLREDAEQERRPGREAIPHREQEHTALKNNTWHDKSCLSQ